MAIEVQTTQNVTIDYEPAGLGNRVLAYLIDIVIMGIWALCWVSLYAVTDGDIFYLAEEYGMIIPLYIIIAAPVTFYHLLFEYYNHGQSPGKQFLKIRVVKVDGSKPSFGAYLLRWLFRPFDIESSNGLLGIVMIVSTKRSQRLGDFLAGTTVISLKMNTKGQELTLMDLDFHEDYKVTYADVLNRLSDKDIQTIRAIIDDDKMKNNDFFVYQLSERTKRITGYNYNGPDIAFLKKVVSDYSFLALQ